MGLLSLRGDTYSPPRRDCFASAEGMIVGWIDLLRGLNSYFLVFSGSGKMDRGLVAIIAQEGEQMLGVGENFGVLGLLF